MSKLYIYENDKGGLYVMSDAVPSVYWELLKQEPDYFVGAASTKEEAMNLLINDAEALDYSKRYLKSFVNSHWR